MMRRFCAFVAVLLLFVGCTFTGASQGETGPQGPQGPQGPAGPQGAHGVNGEDGLDAAQDGNRLTARWIHGADGSRQFNGDFRDADLAGAVCKFDEIDGDLRCWPRIEDSTGYNTFVDPTCTGDLGGPLYKGAHVVRFLATGELFATVEEVPAVYTPTPPPDGPCLPIIAQPGPFYRWAPVEPSDFVLGVIEP